MYTISGLNSIPSIAESLLNHCEIKSETASTVNGMSSLNGMIF